MRSMSGLLFSRHKPENALDAYCIQAAVTCDARKLTACAKGMLTTRCDRSVDYPGQGRGKDYQCRSRSRREGFVTLPGSLTRSREPAEPGPSNPLRAIGLFV